MTSCFALGRVSHDNDNHVMSNILCLIPCFDMDLMSIDIPCLTWFDVKLTLSDTLHYINRWSIDIQGRLRSIDLQVSSVTCWKGLGCLCFALWSNSDIDTKITSLTTTYRAKSCKIGRTIRVKLGFYHLLDYTSIWNSVVTHVKDISDISLRPTSPRGVHVTGCKMPSW